VNGLAVLKRRAGTPDGVLVQEAAAGSGASFAALYDRYEEQVFNYSLRLVGNREDAADATQEAFLSVLRRVQEDESPVLDFKAYLFTAARNESYRVSKRRARSTPTGEHVEPGDRTAGPGDIAADPERSLLLRDAREDVRAANARLPERFREVLALRELIGLSYAEIGAVLGISANAAAQLLFRARARLREEMETGAVQSVAATSEDCERAQLLITMRQDGELVDEEDREWLDQHLDECGSCRASRAVLAEVGVSYRAWLPIAALAGLRHDTIAHAGELVGADWSKAAAAKGAAAHGTTPAAVGAGTVVAVGAVALTLAGVVRHDDATVVPDAAATPAPAETAPARESPAPKPKPRAHKAAAAAARRTPEPAAPPEQAPAGAVLPAVVTHEAPEVSGDLGRPRSRSPGEEDLAPSAPRPAAPPVKERPPEPPAPSETTPTAEAPPPVVEEPPPVVDPPPPPPTSAPECPPWGNGRGHGSCPPHHHGPPPGQTHRPPG
jgi:RNA polymerase sigma factor (sigma-70 family)